MRTILVAVVAVALTTATPVSAAGAGSAVCDFDTGRAVLLVDVKGDATVTLVRGMADEILVDGQDCGATMLTTDRVRVSGDAGDQTLVVDLRGGPFGPGVRSEASREDEVEVVFDAGEGSDTVTVVGTELLDLIGGSTTEWIVNADSDVDGWASGVESASFLGMAGADYLFSTTSHSRSVLYAGGAGNDVLRGLGGNDRLHGGPGDDFLTGRGGNDRLFPGDGADYVHANTGSDRLHLADGTAEADIACGRGEDTVVDADPDDAPVVRDCELFRPNP